MRAVLIFVIVTVVSIASAEEGKRVIVLGGGVTGTWAAAKIASHLNESDELWIVTPPKDETVNDLGNGVFSNYTTSDFIPIGIQIEMASINLEPPSSADIEAAKKIKQLDVNSKIYVSPDLDEVTQSKFERYISTDKSCNRSNIILHYHHDVCYKQWQKYIQEGGKGVDFIGPVILGSNLEILNSLKEKILKNRLDAGYSNEDSELRVLDFSEIAELPPRYAQLIKVNKLNGLLGFNRDGRVKSGEVIQTLNAQIENGAAKLTRIYEWVEGLQIELDDLGNNAVTGIKLRNGKILNADVIVAALGHGAERVLKTANIDLPILKKWGVVYSIPQDLDANAEEPPTIIMRGLGIVRDLPNHAINCALGDWILPEGIEPDSNQVRQFVEQSNQFWKNTSKWNPPIYVQARPMTLDGLPVLDSKTQGLIVVNPSGSQGNTQGPGSGLFAASKTLEQLGREVPAELQLPTTVDWQKFELYPRRFN